MIKNAVFSADRKYRYRLDRRWAEDNKILCFCMLNASDADEERNDPTVRRCIGFAEAWGYSGIVIVNMDALVSMNPKLLLTDPDPIGPENDTYIADAAMFSTKVIAGWGNYGACLPGRAAHVLEILDNLKEVYCFSQTKLGQPRHPLYVKKMPEYMLQVYRPALMKLGDSVSIFDDIRKSNAIEMGGFNGQSQNRKNMDSSR